MTADAVPVNVGRVPAGVDLDVPDQPSVRVLWERRFLQDWWGDLERAWRHRVCGWCSSCLRGWGRGRVGGGGRYHGGHRCGLCGCLSGG